MIKKPASNNYVDNKKLSQELGEWAKRQRERISNDLERERISPYVGKCILDICTNIARKPNFINYPFKEEMIGDAIECCVRYVINFNIEKSTNAFGYISMIAGSAIIRRIKKEKLQMKKHLRFIRGIIDINELTDALNNSTEKNISYYNGYVENMKSLLDELLKDDPEPETEPDKKDESEEGDDEIQKPVKPSEPTIIEIMLNEVN